MYCPKCGREVKSGSNFCGGCGARTTESNRFGERGVRFPGTQNAQHGIKMAENFTEKSADIIGKRTVSIEQLVIAAIALINVCFAPIYDIWGGLFPDDPDQSFLDVITGKCDHSEWIFILTMSILIPSIIMLFFAASKLKVCTKITAGAGVALLLFWILQYAKQYGMEEVFNFRDGSICIGFWFALLIFLVMLTTRTRN